MRHSLDEVGELLIVVEDYNTRQPKPHLANSEVRTLFVRPPTPKWLDALCRIVILAKF